MKHLFVCYTPLHILIAERIIEKENLEKICIIYISESDSLKNKYYYNRIEKKSVISFKFNKTNTVKDFVIILIKLINANLAGVSFYTGNIKTNYSRFIAYLVKPISIFTFDDGIGTIILKDGYFSNEEEGRIGRSFFSLFKKEFLYKNILGLIEKHYTIYKYENVYANVEYLPLFELKEFNSRNLPRINVLLTSALALEGIMSNEEEQKFYDQIMCDFHIDLIIHHPRNDDYHPKNNCKVSSSLLIAEDQIGELLKEYEVKLFGIYYSTVLINVPLGIEKINLVRPSSMQFDGYRRLYERLGIETKVI